MKRWRPGGLQLEIVASLFVVMLAGLAIIAVVMAAGVGRTVEREAVTRMRMGAHQLQRLAATGTGRLADLAALVRTLDARRYGASWSVYDADGRRIVHGAPAPPADAEYRALVERAWREAGVVTGGGLPVTDLVLALPITDLAGRRGTLVGTVAASELSARLMPLFGSLAWVLSIAAVVFVVFGSWLLRRRIVVRVHALSEAARAIGAGELDVRLRFEGADELAELAQRFSEMAASLERQRNQLIEAHGLVSRNERLASVGRLAAGVAHEVGNPVSAILGYAEVAGRGGEVPERTRNAVERIRDEALRIRALVRELLDLARTQELELASHDPVALVRRVLERLGQQALLEGIDLDLSAEEGLPCVEVDERRTAQVVVNLIENAGYAVRGTEAPRIGVRVERARLPRGRARRRQDRADLSFVGDRAWDGVAIRVVDNGCGIDPDDLPHVFDPFFTTKDQGIGTGLGLWNGYRVAELLGGSLEVESCPGRTAFSLILPAADTDGEHGVPARTDHR